MPSGLTPFGQMVFKAVQTYGMVVTDYAGAVMLEAEQPSDWAAEGNLGPTPSPPAGTGRPSTGSSPTCPGATASRKARLKDSGVAPAPVGNHVKDPSTTVKLSDDEKEIVGLHGGEQCVCNVPRAHLSRSSPVLTEARPPPVSTTIALALPGKGSSGCASGQPSGPPWYQILPKYQKGNWHSSRPAQTGGSPAT